MSAECAEKGGLEGKKVTSVSVLAEVRESNAVPGPLSKTHMEASPVALRRLMTTCPFVGYAWDTQSRTGRSRTPVAARAGVTQAV